MSVTAKRLSTSGARGRELDAIVREHLQIIDDKLLHSERTWGRNTIIHDLPVNFVLPGLQKPDAQRIVYSAILRSLDKRGFETRILLESDRTAICIAWMTDLDSQEVEAMSALIRSKRVTGTELEPFLAHGAVPAPHAVSSVRAGVAAPPTPRRFADAGAVRRPRGGVEREPPRPPSAAGSRGFSSGSVGSISRSVGSISRSGSVASISAAESELLHKK
jgi:hypothetical protein